MKLCLYKYCECLGRNTCNFIKSIYQCLMLYICNVTVKVILYISNRLLWYPVVLYIAKGKHRTNFDNIFVILLREQR